MQAFAALSVVLLISASIVVGLRLVALHRRTGGAPELMLGLMLLFSVGIGYPLSISVHRGAGPELIKPAYIVATLSVNVGFTLLYLFTARVFRPGVLWAKVVAGAGIFALFVNAAWRCWDPEIGIRMGGEAASQSVSQIAPVLVGYFWTALESFRYYGMMRRRARLGMGDAAVADRFLLCGGMAVCAASGVSINIVAVVSGINVYDAPAILLASSTCGLGQALFLVLAFAPPQFYLAWVNTRARAMAV